MGWLTEIFNQGIDDDFKVNRLPMAMRGMSDFERGFVGGFGTGFFFLLFLLVVTA